ncbi:MAG TPA: protein kinase [Vicinamibacteria bacterium]|nr:protein kinase [Vicinamibacteria bacterium]
MPQVQPDRGLVGRMLGPYRVVASLGSGGMGEVYLAEDARLGRRVALKVLPADMADRPEKLARFEREAKAVAALTHPGIVTVHDIDEVEGRRFLIMEHVDGDTLTRCIPQHGFPTERFLTLAIAIADALSAAHGKGVLHRDLKPDNVMLAADGRVKVLDFGLAKLRYDVPEDDDTTLRETQSVTQDGRIVGTVAYMSPEQAQGLPVDHRSDIFSLGILLYEMASGERPFKGGTNLSVLSSILKDEPRPVSELRPEVPRPLGRMIQRCLEKRPEDRYQSVSDLRRDLEDLQRDLQSGELLLSTTAGRQRLLSTVSAGRRWLEPIAGRRWLRLAVSAAMLLFVALLGAVVFFGRRPPADQDGRRSVAVFYFDNLSGEPRLDWLRTGLTDMLVTNLSQSSGLRVLGTTRLYQLLDETGHRDDRAVSAQVVQAVSRRAQATTALVGSFVRAGSQIRIQATLQDPATGEVLASERVEGDVETGLFSLVDELTGRLRGRLETRTARRTDGDKKLEDVTTSSLEAMRAYAEGSRFHDRQQEREAQGYFEKAVEADPNFAMALAKLSVVHANLGNLDEARAYAAKAAEKAGHLPPAERYYIEGRRCSLEPAKLEKAVDAYTKAVEAAPEHTAARNNLAQALLELRRYPEALAQLLELRRQGMSFPGTYMSLAEVYVATGQPERAREALTAYTHEHPDSPAGYVNLGNFEVMQGRLDAGLSALDRAAELHPDQLKEVELGRFVAHALQDRWPEARAAGERLLRSEDSRDRWAGEETLALASLYHGDLAEARRLAEVAGAHGGTTDERAEAPLFRARLEEQLGRYHEALVQAGRALEQAQGRPELRARAHAVQALSLARLGRGSESEAAAAAVEQWLSTLPTTLADRSRLHLRGSLALASGDHDQARRYLEKAAALPEQKKLGIDAERIEVLYDLARAALRGGDAEAARGALERIVSAGPDRVLTPVQYVRSLALLASLQDKAGRAAQARALYERYLRHWKHGQIDCDEVARAEQRLSALPAEPLA